MSGYPSRINNTDLHSIIYHYAAGSLSGVLKPISSAGPSRSLDSKSIAAAAANKISGLQEMPSVRSHALEGPAAADVAGKAGGKGKEATSMRTGQRALGAAAAVGKQRSISQNGFGLLDNPLPLAGSGAGRVISNGGGGAVGKQARSSSAAAAGGLGAEAIAGGAGGGAVGGEGPTAGIVPLAVAAVTLCPAGACAVLNNEAGSVPTPAAAAAGAVGGKEGVAASVAENGELVVFREGSALGDDVDAGAPEGVGKGGVGEETDGWEKTVSVVGDGRTSGPSLPFCLGDKLQKKVATASACVRSKSGSEARANCSSPAAAAAAAAGTVVVGGGGKLPAATGGGGGGGSLKEGGKHAVLGFSKVPLGAKPQPSKASADDPLQQLMKPGGKPRGLLRARAGVLPAKKLVGTAGGEAAPVTQHGQDKVSSMGKRQGDIVQVSGGWRKRGGDARLCSGFEEPFHR